MGTYTRFSGHNLCRSTANSVQLGNFALMQHHQIQFSQDAAHELISTTVTIFRVP
jgi:hypothetical protein